MVAASGLGLVVRVVRGLAVMIGVGCWCLMITLVIRFISSVFGMLSFVITGYVLKGGVLSVAVCTLALSTEDVCA